MVSQISEINGIYKLVLPTPYKVGPVNVYLIKGDVLTLVDTGPKIDQTWDVLCQHLKELRLKPEDIEQVVLTHHHPDHVGLLDYLPADIPILGHWKNNPWILLDKEFLIHHERFYKSAFTQFAVDANIHQPALEQMRKSYLLGCHHKQVSRELTEGERVPGLPDWKVIETPGHAGSHIVLYREKDGFMIAGDLIIGHISANPLIEPPYKGEQERAKALPQLKHSLEKCSDLDIKLVLSGHGENIADTRTLIQSRLQKYEERGALIYDWLKEKPLTAFEVCEKLYPSIYKKQLGLTMSSTVGQLDLLEEKNAIMIDKSEDIWRFATR